MWGVHPDLGMVCIHGDVVRTLLPSKEDLPIVGTVGLVSDSQLEDIVKAGGTELVKVLSDDKNTWRDVYEQAKDRARRIIAQHAERTEAVQSLGVDLLIDSID